MHLGFAVQRALNVLARSLNRRRAIGLQRRAEVDRSHLQQPCAIQAEKTLSILVNVDISFSIDVVNNNRFRRVIAFS